MFYAHRQTLQASALPQNKFGQSQGAPAPLATKLLLALWLMHCPACAQEAPQSATANVPQQVTTLTPPERTLGEDWPTFLGPRGDGTSSESGVDPANWQPIPPLRWSLPLGISYGAPTIVAGRLYQFDRYADAERLTCYSAESGDELWHWEQVVRYDDRFGYNNGPRCSPIVDQGRVFLYGVTGNLSCVDAETGQLYWTKDLNTEYDVVPNFFGVASNPCVFGNLLMVMVGGSTPATRGLPTERLADVRPNGTAVVAFDKISGAEVYRLGDGLASYASLVVKPVAGRELGLAFLRDGLLGWEPTSGEVLFEFPWRAPMLESVNAAMPVVVGSNVLISEAYEVGSAYLDVSEISDARPKVVWRDGGPRSRCRFRAHWATPVALDGYLYGCSGRNGPDTDFRCVRLSDGQVMWTDRDRDRQRSSLLLVDGYLIVLGETGTVELIRPNAEKLEVVARADLNELRGPVGNQPLVDAPCWAAPVVSHGLLYVRGNDTLLCLDLIPQR